jgi:hypothetical protein
LVHFAIFAAAANLRVISQQATLPLHSGETKQHSPSSEASSNIDGHFSAEMAVTALWL